MANVEGSGFVMDQVTDDGEAFRRALHDARFGQSLVGDDREGDADCLTDTEADPIIEADR